MDRYGEEMQRSVALAGREVTRVGLGTNRLTRTPANVAFIRAAVDAGLQVIDTAHLYTGGESEATIGEALGGPSDRCLVATKGGFRPGEGKPEVLRQQVEESLRKLRVDAIDLYYLHRVDPETPLEESVGELRLQVEAGRIRHVGISAVTVAQLEQARKVLPIAAVQNHFNLEERQHDDVVDYCEREGIVFVPYFPLRGGGSPREALTFLLERSPMVLPIPGTLSLEHLKENLSVLSTP